MRRCSDRYEENRETLDALIETITELGRLPEPDEFALSEPAIEAFGSLKRAFALIRRVTSEEDWETVRRQRSKDLLVYLALANFAKRPKLTDLSQNSTFTSGSSWQTTTADSASRKAETVQLPGWDWKTLTSCGSVARDKESNTLHRCWIVDSTPKTNWRRRSFP